MTQDEVVALVRKYVRYCAAYGGTRKTAAKSWGVSPQYLSDVLEHRREPGPKILKALGLRKVVTYEEDTKGG